MLFDRGLASSERVTLGEIFAAPEHDATWAQVRLSARASHYDDDDDDDD